MIVSNSTTLIAFSKLGLLDILKEYFEEIVVPKEVYTEVVTRGGKLFGALEVKEAKWIKVEEVKNRIAVESLLNYIDKGEAEAIILAREKNAKLLLIDDLEGREIAERFGLKVTGTVGILLLAVKEKRIDLKGTLDMLISSGFRLSKEEYDKILRKEK